MHDPIESRSLVAVLLALVLVAPGRAQIPDGATVVASFANGANPNGGLFVVDCAGTALPITGLPPALAKANCVVRHPATGHLVSGEISAGGSTITVYEVAVGPGLAATVVSAHALGTADATNGGGVDQATMLPDGRVLLATHGIVAGPAASQDLWILDLATGGLTPPPLGWLTNTSFNAVAVSASGTHAYVAPYQITGQIHEVPLQGPGVPRQIAQLPSTSGNQWFATGLLWDCNGALVATATRLPLGSPGAICCLTPSATGFWPSTFVQYPQMPILQGGSLDPVTCDLVLVTGLVANAPVAGLGSQFRLDPAGVVRTVTTGPAPGWGSPSGVDLDPNPEPYGIATPSPNGLRLEWQYAPFPGRPPRLGSAGFVLMARALGGTPVVSAGLVSFQRADLPVAGIRLLLDPAVMTSLGLDFTATPTFPLSIPNVPALSGLRFHAQALGLDSAGAAASTAGLTITIQC